MNFVAQYRKEKESPFEADTISSWEIISTFQGMSCISEVASSSTTLLCVLLARLKPRNRSALSTYSEDNDDQQTRTEVVTTLLGTRVHKPC